MYKQIQKCSDMNKKGDCLPYAEPFKCCGIFVSPFKSFDDVRSHAKNVAWNNSYYYCFTCECNFQSIQQHKNFVTALLNKFSPLPFDIIERITFFVIKDLKDQYTYDRAIHHIRHGLKDSTLDPN